MSGTADKERQPGYFGPWEAISIDGNESIYKKKGAEYKERKERERRTRGIKKKGKKKKEKNQHIYKNKMI